MKCYLIKDLLSNYIDGLNSEETNEEIRKHLEECNECHALYEKMSAVIPDTISIGDHNIDFLKKLRNRMLRKNVIVAVLTCFVVFAGFFIFARNYELPLPFDRNRMLVESFTAAVIIKEDGTISWQEKDRAVSRGIIPEDYGNTMELVRLAYRGINRISSNSRSRNINRNGENIRVVYFCYTKTLWDSLFIDGDLDSFSESGNNFGTNIYGNSFQTSDYESQMTEIYYYPVRNLHKIDNLSDEEFDQLRENSGLVWSGVV